MSKRFNKDIIWILVWLTRAFANGLMNPGNPLFASINIKYV